jgi:uncharacterized protein
MPPAVPATIPPLNGVSSYPALTPVLGRNLRYFSPGVGYMRLGYCNYTSIDPGPHTIASIVTKEFLEFSRARGNDLITPRLEHGFWGLTEGCRWCVGVQRWIEAFRARGDLGDSIVPRYVVMSLIDSRVVLEATALRTLQYVPLENLDLFSVEDGPLTQLFPFSSR